MGVDVLTVLVAFISFGIFLLAHLIIFRRVAPERLLKTLLACVVALGGLPVLLMVILYYFKVVDAPLQAWVCVALLACLLQGLLCFFYVLCVFGPYETSVRMRLVREIDRAGDKGISLEGLLGQYNAQTILDIRLQRLIGSGDIIEKDGKYRLADRHNFFFIFDAIAGILKKCIGQ